MANTLKAGRRATLKRLLPNTPHTSWGVWLKLADGYHDKEYRVVVVDKTTYFQYGRRGAAGEVSISTHETNQDATDFARKKWLEKEAKGYWPVAGVVSLNDPQLTVKLSKANGFYVSDSLEKAYSHALRKAAELIGDGCADVTFCVVQTPDSKLVARLYTEREMLRTLWGLGCSAGTISEDVEIADLSYQILPVPVSMLAIVKEICPTVIELEGVGDNAFVAGQLALSLANSLTYVESARETLATAVELVGALTS